MRFIVEAIKQQYPTELRNYVGLQGLVECLEDEMQETTPDKGEIVDILTDIDEVLRDIKKGGLQ